MRSEKIIILGAGLVGSLISIYLRKAGYEVTIYEKRHDPRKSNTYAGRSINLAMSMRGLNALEQVGLKDKILARVVPMNGRQMHAKDGSLGYQPYGKEGQHINAISRALLNDVLMEEAEKQGVQIHFDHRCVDVNTKTTTAVFEHESDMVEASADLLIGADGAFSALRSVMQRTDRFNYSQQYIEHGYKEFTISTKNGDFAMNPNALHIWPRGNFMMIALPNLDKSFTCTLFFPFEGDLSFSALNSRDKVDQFFKEQFPDLIELMPDYLEQYITNPTSSLVTVKCYPWVANRSMLIGDASHAIVPFYGQGMNAGFEDCFVFDQLAKQLSYDWDKVLPAFQQLRKKDADAIADLALQNFVEMRDKVADERFLFQKKIEAELHLRYPNEWIPQYTLVTFSDVPYSTALAKGGVQNTIVNNYITEATMANPSLIDYEKIMEDLRASGYS